MQESNVLTTFAEVPPSKPSRARYLNFKREVNSKQDSNGDGKAEQYRPSGDQASHTKYIRSFKLSKWKVEFECKFKESCMLDHEDTENQELKGTLFGNFEVVHKIPAVVCLSMSRTPTRGHRQGVRIWSRGQLGLQPVDA